VDKMKTVQHRVSQKFLFAVERGSRHSLLAFNGTSGKIKRNKILTLKRKIKMCKLQRRCCIFQGPKWNTWSRKEKKCLSFCCGTDTK